MGNTLYKASEDRVKYMKSPELSPEAAQEMVPELVSEIGRHDYAGIVSIGPVGVGKSSNLNTIASFMANKLEQQAASGGGTGSLTKESTAHLISYQGRPVKWKWMDTPGDLFTDLVELWKRMDLPEETPDHVSQAQYDAQIQELLISPLRQHHIGCVMAFLSAHELFANSIRTEVGSVVKMSAAPSSRLSFHLQVLKDLHQRLVQQGLRMVCMITKVDLIDPSIAHAVSNVMYSHDIHLCRQFVARDTGMPVNQVHPLVNLVTDFDPQDNLPLGHLALFNVRNALAAARHSALPPPAPVSSASKPMEWDTLTFPSRITSEDGLSGRSHPVNGVPSYIGTVEPSAAMNGHARSIAPSMVTDVDQELLKEGSEAHA